MFTQNRGLQNTNLNRTLQKSSSTKPTINVAEILYVIGGLKNTEKQRDIAI